MCRCLPTTFRTAGLAVAVCAVLAFCTAPAVAESFRLGVNFVGDETFSPGGEARLEPDDLAGAVPQTHWTNAAGGCSSLTDLPDASGNRTGVDVTWRADTFYLPVADASTDHRLMRGRLAPLGSDPVTVTVTGLDGAAPGPYDVLVYFDCYTCGSQAADVAMTFTIGNTVLTGTDLAGADFAGTFVEDTGAGGNVVRFHGLTGDGFALEVAGSPAAVNALQVVHAPEPATLLLAAAGAALCAAGRRRGTRT